MIILQNFIATSSDVAQEIAFAPIICSSGWGLFKVLFKEEDVSFCSILHCKIFAFLEPLLCFSQKCLHYTTLTSMMFCEIFGSLHKTVLKFSANNCVLSQDTALKTFIVTWTYYIPHAILHLCANITWSITLSQWLNHLYITDFTWKSCESWQYKSLVT